MKKRIVTLLLALVMVASLMATAIPAFAADGDITLRLHYHREDGNYEGWEMWFWDNDSVTKLDPPYAFEEIDGEMISTIQINPGTMKVGFIVRFGDWVEKDIDADQFIDITGILAGTVDVYVESGVEGYELVKGADVKEGVVVTGSDYKEENNDGNPEVRVKMSSKLDYEATTDTFVVANADGAIGVTAVKVVNSYYYLTLAEKLDPKRGYFVTFEGNNYDVTMPDYYSSEEFEAEFTYTGDDLGATYTPEKTSLRLWAPTAITVNVNLYANGEKIADELPTQQVPMTKDVNGTWICELPGDMNGTYYTYEVTTDNDVVEAPDPYARTTGVNGDRAMIIDLSKTNPEGWDADKNPNAGKNYTDAVIYELHVRDLSSDASSGVSSAHVGKYLGLIESGTKNSNGIATGLDHIVDLGVTHVHLLPVYDYGSVDETKLNEKKQFNWGYDPVNYNVPEGSYSTDPYNGEVRVKEFKQMVKGMHDAGLSVIMDVVYNHVYNTDKFCVNQIVPGYFTRPGANGSGCGNDVASERAMVSKYIVDSVNYWADEYHIDGFRFDLVGLIDTDTINKIVETVHAKHPDIIFYGEGWTLNTKVTKTGYTLATQNNSAKTPDFAYFNDTVRNLIKGGDGFGTVSAGYISGGSASIADLNSCFKGMPSWCTTPSQSINYISCHDNHALFDHITMVNNGASVEDNIARNKLGAAFYMTAQGIPFFQAGEEMLRSKPFEGSYHENSYNAPDEVNSLKWDDLNKPEYMNVYEYYKGLIAFRKAHPALRLTDAASVNSAVEPVAGLPAGVAAYSIAGGVNGETSEGIFCAFNASKTAQTVTLPEGTWNICVNADKAGTEPLGTAAGSVEVPAMASLILVKDSNATPPVTEPDQTTANTENNGNNGGSNSSNNMGLIIALVAVGVVAIAIVVALIAKKKK